jgi:hypothetical protein
MTKGGDADITRSVVNPSVSNPLSAGDFQITKIFWRRKNV